MIPQPQQGQQQMQSNAFGMQALNPMMGGMTGFPGGMMAPMGGMNAMGGMSGMPPMGMHMLPPKKMNKMQPPDKWSDLPPSNTVYVNNLNEKISRDELVNGLREVFSQYGEILDVICYTKIKKCKGQAWIVYDKIDSAKNAVAELNNFAFFYKPLRVAFSKSKSHATLRKEGVDVPKKEKKPKKKPAEDKKSKKKQKIKKTDENNNNEEKSDNEETEQNENNDVESNNNNNDGNNGINNNNNENNEGEGQDIKMKKK